jgi:hypothetical protein
MKPQRNSRYLAWIRTQPCCVCGSTRGIEASHTGSHGIGPEISRFFRDPAVRQALPHRLRQLSPVGSAKILPEAQSGHPAIVRRLNLKPTIRVEQGWFVTYLDDHRYVLGKTGAGVRPAVREALQLCRENQLAQHHERCLGGSL